MPQQFETGHTMSVKTLYSLRVSLVSVIIPCFNQARFLGEAIESVVRQSYCPIEIIVVDDGSTDNTSEVAARYLMVRCIKQENRGLAAARNTGIRESSGDYLIFLDADDRLLPNAIEVGLKYLYAHPECAFASGDYRLVAHDGTILEKPKAPQVNDNHYLALLRRNYIAMHATVMYQRSVLESVGGFDTFLPTCEDYDLYLRIAKYYPIYCHNEVVAEYRRHGANMSSNNELMLKTALGVLRLQWNYVKGNKQYEEAFKAGIMFWKELYGSKLIRQTMTYMCMPGEGKQAIQGMKVLFRYVGGLTLLVYGPLWCTKQAVKQLRHLVAKR